MFNPTNTSIGACMRSSRVLHSYPSIRIFGSNSTTKQKVLIHRIYQILIRWLDSWTVHNNNNSSHVIPNWWGWTGCKPSLWQSMDKVAALKQFYHEVAAPLYLQISRSLREVMSWNHAPRSKPEHIKEGKAQRRNYHIVKLDITWSHWLGPWYLGVGGI